MNTHVKMYFHDAMSTYIKDKVVEDYRELNATQEKHPYWPQGYHWTSTMRLAIKKPNNAHDT